MQQAHVFISGTVQGVGFRQFVKSNAVHLGVTGWIQNAEDGGVEAVFCGDEEKIEELLEICKKGPILSVVKQVGFDWEEPEKFTDFQIH